MIMNVVALSAEDMTFAERASMAGIVSLQGMLTIFLVLSILWGAIELLHYFLVGRKEKSVAATKDAPAEEATVQPSPVVENAPVAPVATDDGAIVAAITAAISAQLADDGYTGAFRVVSFKRVGVSSKKRI